MKCFDGDKRVLRSRQAGVSIAGLVIVLVVLGVVAVIGMRVFPTVVEYQGILRAVDKAKAGSTPNEVRNLYDRAAQVEGITSVKGEDLDITKDDNGNVLVRFAYNKELHLAGPAFLLLKYSGRSK